MATELTIGQLAKEAKVNVQTVRYYERLKLLSPTTRLPSGYRLYGPTEAQRLRFIKNAQSLGFALQEIAELLSLRISARARCGDVQRKTQAKLKQVKTKIRDLQTLARALHGLIRNCQAGQPTDHCPILQTLERKERRQGDETRNTTR
ncbi:MAG: heavy metal-responsive transcriptional regulator [Gaiellales bacterium]|nr:MAG: heavy metal-responsive transcriptional regulator [Gaiellales bacterium]